MRHETESRYVADVKYLGGTMPVPEDYADCNSPPQSKPGLLDTAGAGGEVHA